MEKENIDVPLVQEKNSGARKGFYYDRELGGYVPAKSKSVKDKSEESPVLLIVLLALGAVGILAYIFRDNLKALWIDKVKEALKP